MDGEGQSAVCGGPSDLAPDPRETAQRSDWRGKRPLVTLGLSKVTRPSPKGGRNPFEASGLASCTARPCHTQRLLPPTPCLGTDDYAYRLIDPTIARRSRACLPQARSLAERPVATDKGGPGRPYRPKKASQSLNRHSAPDLGINLPIALTQYLQNDLLVSC